MTAPSGSDHEEQDEQKDRRRRPSVGVGVYMGAPDARDLYDFDADLFPMIDQCYRLRVNFAVYPIGGHERNAFDINSAELMDDGQIELPPIKLSPLFLLASDWARYVCPATSAFIDCDSGTPAVAAASRRALRQELQFAQALGVRALLVRPPHAGCRLDRRPELAKILAEFLWRRNVGYRVWVLAAAGAEQRSAEQLWHVQTDAAHAVRHVDGVPYDRDCVNPLGRFDHHGRFVYLPPPVQSTSAAVDCRAASEQQPPAKRSAKKARGGAAKKKPSSQSTDSFSSSSAEDDFYADDVLKLYTTPDLSDVSDADDAGDPWVAWRTFRTWLRSHRSLYCVLLLDNDLSVHNVELKARTRWLAEPVAAIMMSTGAFFRRVDVPAGNSAAIGQLPVTLQLPRAHAVFLHMFVDFAEDVQTILVGSPEEPLNGRITEHRKQRSPAFEVLLEQAKVRIKLYKDALKQAVGDDRLRDYEPMSGKYHMFAQVSVAAQGYDDVIQVPLQPLADHLDNFTYETFEKDVLKYELYGKAYGLALEDMIRKRQLEAGRAGSLATVTVVTMLLGGGRGGIANECLLQARELRRRLAFNLRFCIVEKNPAAVLALRHRMHRHKIWLEFENELELWEEDMRVAAHRLADEPAAKADVIVSELLGSFGDNELSPECLDGAMGLCKPDVVSIPSRYTSYVRPVASVRVMNAVFDQMPNVWAMHQGGREVVYPIELGASSDSVTLDDSGQRPLTAGFERLSIRRHLNYDSVFVVKMSASYSPHDDAKPVFTFEHPNWATADSAAALVNGTAGDDAPASVGDGGDASADPPRVDERRNERLATVAFGPVPFACEVSGLAGYFDAALYKDVLLSIVPGTHSHCPKTGESLFSWFPAFIPFRTPIFVDKGQPFTVQLARRSDAGGVWYEWRCNSPTVTDWQNAGGATQYVKKLIGDS